MSRERKPESHRSSISPGRCRNFPLYLVPVAMLLLFRNVLPVNLCDDAYISFKVALNAASGNGMFFNPGENTYISTSPAWVLLLTGLRFLLGDVLLAARMLGSVFEILLVLTIVHCSRRIHQGTRAGMFAAVLLITNPVFLLTSFSGMELPLFLLTVVLTAYLISEKRFAGALVCGACSVWVRFDGILVFGAALAAVLWLQRTEVMKRPSHILTKIAPSLFIISGYVLFGALFFETWLPMSFLRKVLTSPDLFSPEWVKGGKIMAKEFGNALLGKSAYWYGRSTFFPFMAIALAVGTTLQLVKKETTLVPLALITVVYFTVFVASGSAYARNFPWYFVPILPGVYLSCGVGLAWLLSTLTKKSALLRRAQSVGILPALLALGWAVLAFKPLSEDGTRLTTVKNERERVYASAGVWVGKHLDKGALIAANEIGAVGFFLPPDAPILDMFGVLRRRHTLREPFVRLVEQELPECIFTRTHFHYKEEIEAALENKYNWFRFRTLDIGMRSDLKPHLEPHLHDLGRIYDALDVDREFPYD